MQGVESNTTTHLSHAIVKASSLEPSPREYGAGGTYFPRSYSYNMPATDDAVAEHQGLGAPGASQQPQRHRRTQSLDPRLSIHSGDSSGTPRTARLSQAGRSGSLQTVKHRISLALHRGSQVWQPQHDMLSCLILCNESTLSLAACLVRSRNLFVLVSTGHSIEECQHLSRWCLSPSERFIFVDI